jgi:hypothetical protein
MDNEEDEEEDYYINNAIHGALSIEDYKHFLLLYKRCKLFVGYDKQSKTVKVFLSAHAASRECDEYIEAEFIAE